MSTVTKSKDARFAGRSYTESAEYYAQRVACAEAYKAKGHTHKHAWFKAFQEYPRVYEDEVPVQGCANKVETVSTTTGVHVSTFQPVPGTFGTSSGCPTSSLLEDSQGI